MFHEGDGDASDDNAPKAKQINSDIVQDPLEQIAHPGKQLVPSEEEADLKSRLLESFIDDIEKSIKVFMSSYMRDKGLIWQVCLLPYSHLAFMSCTGLNATSSLHPQYFTFSFASCCGTEFSLDSEIIPIT